MDPAPVTDLIEAFRRSKTMFTAVEFGVFERLHQVPQTLDQLAAAMGLWPEPLSRLLNACCGLGLLTLTDGLYANTPAADTYLRRQSPATLTGYIEYSNRVLFPMWGHLEDAIREGTHRWQQVFGLQGDAIFSHFFRSEQARNTFLSGMHGYGLLSSPQVVRVFNLNGFRHLVDLGGGTGHLAIAACERYAHLRGTVFDLPGVVDAARPFIEASRAKDRLSVQPGDFFHDPLPPADLYACGRILHDWGEEKIRRLLATIHAALPPGGGLLLMEAVLDDDGCGPGWALMQSLNMLVCTEGRERTAAGYRDILTAAGFVEIDVRRTGAPHDAILALKAAT